MGSEFSEYFSPYVFTYTLQNLFLSLKGCLKWVNPADSLSRFFAFQSEKQDSTYIVIG